ncbi:hypothetical protein [Halanaeroarchaeum sp. HSR-CO]|uniref:hypothetical protein n=1 Tax=Halanaeroarchaeum sp. HSR-CO TaxID=2866382 RepID=UPI00217CF982|nr:hypothetical protein [Halanaeroarchaeum sp. HSR-CO]
MQRRQVLATVTALLPLAGCASPGSPTDETTTTEPTTTSERPPNGPKYEGAEIDVLDVQCASGDETAATASIVDATVVVEETIIGNNGCYVAKLDTIVHDEAESELHVTVRSVEERAEDEACIECITAIDYEVTARFRGGHPDRVVVAHGRDGGDVREVASIPLETTTS